MEKVVRVVIHDLRQDENKEKADAYLLEIHGLLELFEMTADEMLMEQDAKVQMDTKGFMRGREVNLLARYASVFADHDVEPDYANKQGRVTAWTHVPLLARFRNEVLPLILGERARGLMGEGNYYYDLEKCYIGYHGDGERVKVVCLRLGDENRLAFRWFHQGIPLGLPMEFNFGHGVVYAMSQEAVGTHWKQDKKEPRLRHCAGKEELVAWELKNKKGQAWAKANGWVNPWAAAKEARKRAPKRKATSE